MPRFSWLANEKPGGEGPDTDDALQRTRRIRRPGAKAADHTALLLGILAAGAHARYYVLGEAGVM